MTKEIVLTKGKVALVDDEMYPFLSRFNWYANRQGYAERMAMVLGTYKKILMHRVVACAVWGDFPTDHFVDHHDRNKLNNQSTNIRFASRGQNACNRHGWGRTNPYKGVYEGRKAKTKTWRALIQKDKVRVHLGYFPTPEDAARAYDRAAIDLHGPYAVLNFPEEQRSE